MSIEQISDPKRVPGPSAGVASALGRAQGMATPNFCFAQGEFEITVLSDGFLTIPGDVLVTKGTSEQRASMLARLGSSGGMVRPKTNIPVIRCAKDVILVDVGSGQKYQPSDGKLTENMKQAKIDPSSVTKVVFTHAHPDHIWGTLKEDGSLRFPNAAYYVGAAEWEFWMDPDFLNKLPARLHDFARGAQRDLGAVRDSVVLLKPGDEVVNNIRALGTFGHTPGHLSLEVAGGDGLLIAVDVANNEVVSFEHPEWPFGYDTVPDLAIETRKRMLDRAATDRTKLLGYHWAYPGLGFAERRNGAYVFEPSV